MKEKCFTTVERSTREMLFSGELSEFFHSLVHYVFFFFSISFGRAITILRAFVCVSVYSVFVVPSFHRWLIIFLFMSSLFVCSFVT